MKAYFEFMGVMLAAYAIVRLAIGWEFRSRPMPEKRWDPMEPELPGIDASKLASRVEQLRQAGYAGVIEKSASFKKPLMVEEKRREMEKLAFFQNPPPEPPEPPEHEDGMRLLFI